MSSRVARTRFAPVVRTWFVRGSYESELSHELCDAPLSEAPLLIVYFLCFSSWYSHLSIPLRLYGSCEYENKEYTVLRWA